MPTLTREDILAPVDPEHIRWFCAAHGPRIRFKNTVAKPAPERSSWWLVCLAISAVLFAIWGLHL